MHRIIFMLTLVLAGELIFGLPFHTTRFFRPTFLEAFSFSNTQLGDVFAVYGITAMLAYFPGGVIADHYSPRALMTLSLFATAAGGLYMATFPGQTQLAFLYGFWGLSTVLVFWSAMISATRECSVRSRKSEFKALKFPTMTSLRREMKRSDYTSDDKFIVEGYQTKKAHLMVLNGEGETVIDTAKGMKWRILKVSIVEKQRKLDVTTFSL